MQRRIKFPLLVKCDMPAVSAGVDVVFQLEGYYTPAYPLIMFKKNGDPGDQPPSPESVEDVVATLNGQEIDLTGKLFDKAVDVLIEAAKTKIEKWRHDESE